MAALDVTVHFDIRATEAALDAMAEAAKRFTADAMENVIRETWVLTRRNLSAQSHPPRTRTPSLPGEPPARVSRHLVESVVRDGPHQLPRHVWHGSVGPTAVYSRVQELGGSSGKNRRTHLPARPYLKAAWEELDRIGFYRDEFLDAFHGAIHEGTV